MLNSWYNYTQSWSDVVGWGSVTEVLVGGQGNGLCDNIWLENLALAINLVLPLVHFKLVALLPSLPAASSPSWRSGMLIAPLPSVDCPGQWLQRPYISFCSGVSDRCLGAPHHSQRGLTAYVIKNKIYFCFEIVKVTFSVLIIEGIIIY